MIKLNKVSQDLTDKERALYDHINVLKNTNQKDDIKIQRYLEEIHRLKNKIKDQELQEDLRHNYVYQILFENWKKKHKALAPYDRKELKLPNLQDDDRTRRDEWIEYDEEQIQFPSLDEINEMNLEKVDFFDVDKFHNMNVERLKKLGKPKKEEDKRYKFDINVLDDKLFGKMDEANKNPKEEPFQVKPMYTDRSHHNSTTNEYGDEKKVYANTLRSNGEFDNTFERASNDGLTDLKKSVRFGDRSDGHRSIIDRPMNRNSQYQSPLQIASKMITS